MERRSPTRTIEAKTLVRLDVGALVALRYDPYQGGVLVGYRLSGDDYYHSTDPYPGYAIVYLGAELVP